MVWSYMYIEKKMQWKIEFGFTAMYKNLSLIRVTCKTAMIYYKQIFWKLCIVIAALQAMDRGILKEKWGSHHTRLRSGYLYLLSHELTSTYKIVKILCMSPKRQSRRTCTHLWNTVHEAGRRPPPFWRADFW